MDHPKVLRQLLLESAAKRINETLGPEVIVPSALVLGDFPCLRTIAGPVIPN